MNYLNQKISVLMPVYNTEKFLDESITSILNQTFGNFDFIILDDASQDNSLKIIKKYAQKDKRITILQNKKNQGESFCRARLVETAKTPVIAWMDADDISLKHRLKTQVEFLNYHPEVDVVGCQVKYFNKKEYFISSVYSDDCSIKSAMLFINSITGANTIVKINKQQYPYSKKIRIAPDYHYWVDNASNFCFHNLKEVLYEYRDNNQGIIRTNVEGIRQAHFSVVKKHLAKFSIEFIKDGIRFLREGGSIDLQSFKKHLIFLDQVLNIQNFYQYQGVNKKIILDIYFSKFYSCEQNLFLPIKKDELKKIWQPLPLLVKANLFMLIYFNIYRITGSAKSAAKVFLKHFGVRAFLYLAINRLFWKIFH